MKKSNWLLKTLATLTILALLVLGLAWYLSQKIRHIQEPLVQFLKSQIHGDVQITEAKVTWLPLGISLRQVQLFAPNETKPSAKIREAQLEFAWAPLLQRKVEISLNLEDPEIFLRTDGKKPSNMEVIFEPLIAGQSGGQSWITSLGLKHLAVNELNIHRGYFTIDSAGKPLQEVKNISLEAKNIRLDSENIPAKIALKFLLPQVSPKNMELNTDLLFKKAQQQLLVKAGQFRWGDLPFAFSGSAQLPQKSQKDISLKIHFNGEKVSLKKLFDLMQKPAPGEGTLSISGDILGSVFAPEVHANIQSKSLKISGKNIRDLQANLIKKNEQIQITDSQFTIYGGQILTRGFIFPGIKNRGDLNINLKSLSLAEISGKSENPARLSGNLQLKNDDLANLNSFFGGGNVQLGPILLPSYDLRQKIKIADLLARTAGLDKMVPAQALSSSRDLIGSKINQVTAQIKIAGNEISLVPFQLGNENFNASGTGTIFQQKTIQAQGTFHLLPKSTALILPDPKFRNFLTEGKNSLDVPFTASGPIEDPKIQIDQGYLDRLISKAATVGISNILAGQLQPQKLIDNALKNSPLGDPKNPLQKILNQPLPVAPNDSPGNPKQKPVTGKKVLDHFLFGQ